MGREYAEIEEGLREFIDAQKMFFVATAPLSGEGLVNLSPKGLETLQVLDPHTVAYLDLTGSGIETISHLRENGRIVLMFCAFTGPPKIVRLQGRGEVLEPDHPDFAALRPRFPALDGARSIIRVRVQRIADSCGYAVPLYDYQGQRRQLLEWVERKGPAGLEEYRERNNAASLDGLPGLRGRGG